MFKLLQSQKYSPVAGRDEDNDAAQPRFAPTSAKISRRFKTFYIMQIVYMMLITAVSLYLWTRLQYWKSRSWQAGFSTDYWELRGLVETKEKEFVNHIRPHFGRKQWEIEWEDGTPHYGGEAGPETDAAWNELLAAINFNRTGDKAVPIMDKTYGYEDGRYFMGLEVYHALHCINNLRMTLSPDHYLRYTMADRTWATHMGHCIDYLSQYARCNADLTPMFFEDLGFDHNGLVPGSHHSAPLNLVIRRHIAHTCRDFDQVHGWILGQNPDPLAILDHNDKK